MGFRLVPNSLTLNDFERRNRPNGCVISLNSVAFGTDYVKVVAAAEIYAKEFSFQRYIIYCNICEGYGERVYYA